MDRSKQGSRALKTVSGWRLVRRRANCPSLDHRTAKIAVSPAANGRCSAILASLRPGPYNDIEEAFVRELRHMAEGRHLVPPAITGGMAADVRAYWDSTWQDQ